MSKASRSGIDASHQWAPDDFNPSGVETAQVAEEDEAAASSELGVQDPAVPPRQTFESWAGDLPASRVLS